MIVHCWKLGKLTKEQEIGFLKNYSKYIYKFLQFVDNRAVTDLKKTIQTGIVVF